MIYFVVVVRFFAVTKPASICNHKKYRNDSHASHLLDFTLSLEYPYFSTDVRRTKIRRRIRLSAAAWSLASQRHKHCCHARWTDTLVGSCMLVVVFWLWWRLVLFCRNSIDGQQFDKMWFLYGWICGCLSALMTVLVMVLLYKLVDRILSIPLVGNYSDRYILVTGCDSGFGHELAKRLDSLGCHALSEKFYSIL